MHYPVSWQTRSYPLRSFPPSVLSLIPLSMRALMYPQMLLLTNFYLSSLWIQLQRCLLMSAILPAPSTSLTIPLHPTHHLFISRLTKLLQVTINNHRNKPLIFLYGTSIYISNHASICASYYVVQCRHIDPHSRMLLHSFLPLLRLYLYHFYVHHVSITFITYTIQG